MNDLIVINYDSENPTVGGRDLHAALEVSTRYNDWFTRMCEYGFTEGKDFYSFLSKSDGGRPSTDHRLTIPMAKEICMLQRSEMGKKFRQYFIAVEEAWNSPEKIMERALQIAHKRAEEAERRILRLAEENETLEIALNTSLQFFTVAKYNNVYKMGWNLSESQKIGKRLSAYCRSNSIEIRKCQTNDERFGETNSYPLTAWEALVGFSPYPASIVQ
jgi:phage anti-repressor protein